jgi:hypothetical protein
MVFFAPTAACGGFVTEHTGAEGAADSGVVAADASPPSMPGDAAPIQTPDAGPDGGVPACVAASAGTPRAEPDIATFTAQLAGRWWLCSGIGLDLNLPAPAGVEVAGLELDADGTFAVLAWDATHTNLVRMRTVFHHGTYAVEPNQPPYDFQVNATFDLSGGPGLVSHFTDAPAQLIMSNEGLVYRYIPLQDAFPAGAPPVVDEPDPTVDANGCAPTGVLHMTTDPGFIGTAVGRWRLCSGTGVSMGTVTNERGLALDRIAPTGGRYAVLVPGTGTDLVAASGPWSAGNYIAGSSGSQPVYELDLSPDSTQADGGGSGSTSLRGQLTDSPRLLVSLNGSDANVYAPVAGGVDAGPD